jgi:CobQ-like glutamine amidotransferase family enzyme
MKQVVITHLYPKEMNIYGDNGNVLVLQKRLQWLGYKVKVNSIGINEKIPADTNIIIGGGGQDAGQNDIANDLINQKKKTLMTMADNGVSMLMICGLYQLFGQYFRTSSNLMIPGLGILDAYTIAGQKRLIGNVIVKSDKFGQIIGYENHSGRTIINSDSLNKPLGKVPVGQGNNGDDGFEGCIKNNVIGSYLHGPILAKNNKLTNHIIEQATGRIIEEIPKELIFVDKLVEKARTVAKKLER